MTVILMSAFEDWSLFWAGLSAVSTFLAFVVVAVAAYLTLQQVREATRARKLESTLAIFDHASSADLRNVRRLIRTKHAEITKMISTKPSWHDLNQFLETLSEGSINIEHFHAYLASLENISILVLHDLAPDEIVEFYFLSRAVRQWESLAPFILYMREVYQSTNFLQHFEMFVKLVKQGAYDATDEMEMPLFPLTPRQQMKRAMLAERRGELAKKLKAEPKDSTPLNS